LIVQGLVYLQYFNYSMQIFRIPSQFHAFCKESGKSSSIGFVPTMGALHEGHLALVKKAKSENTIVVVSIFVNPLQFNNPEDLKKYPRTESEDLAMLEAEGVNAVLIPDPALVYEAPTALSFDFGNLERVMEGAFRSGHFNGVAVIVSKLFHWASPDRVYFGQKDLQQVRIVETLIRDLSFPFQLVCCPTFREESGLAMSSRNRRLSETGKIKAASIYKSLLDAKKRLQDGLPIAEVKKLVSLELEKNGDFKVEYFEITDYETLQPLQTLHSSSKVALCIAAFLEEVRLIDNILIEF
jgi:pantoate--beta-alanine ligase